MKKFKVNFEFMDYIHEEKIQDYMLVEANSNCEAKEKFLLSLHNPESYIITVIEEINLK